MNNYEWIKSLSIDDMAEFVEQEDCYYCVAEDFCDYKRPCRECVRMWLELEREGECE